MKRLIPVVVLLAGAVLSGQTVTTKCPGGNVTTTLPDGTVTVVCTGTVPPPPPPVGTAAAITAFNASASTITAGQSVTLSWTVTGNPAPTVTLTPGGVVTGTSVVVTPTATTIYTLSATNSVGAAVPRSWTVTVTGVPPPPPPPPPPTAPIFPGEVTDPNLLGTCSKARHDSYLVLGPDGVRYWRWHPQADPSGCVYKHEHGHDPTPIVNALIAHFQSKPVTATFTQARKDEIIAFVQKPMLMGYVAKRMPATHAPEPHGGFKVFYALFNEPNDEGRNSLMLSLHMTHMGTGGVGRFGQPHHSVHSWQVHIPTGAYQITQLMLDFGTADMVCPPRQIPTRDFIVINTSRCKINSSYEIWSGQADIRENGQTLFRAFATPAAFDPITVMNRANPGEVVYAWDPRVLATRAFSTPSWAGFKGCNREAYAQPGHYNQTGDHMRWTDPFGNVVAPNAPNAVQQWFGSPVASTDLRGSTIQTGSNETAGNHAFKKPRANCALAGSLGLLN